jgi:hypothetical protein
LYYNKAGRLPNPLSFLELMPGCAEHNHIMHLGMGGSTIPEMRGKAGLRFGGRSHIQKHYIALPGTTRTEINSPFYGKGPPGLDPLAGPDSVSPALNGTTGKQNAAIVQEVWHK